VSGVSGAVRRRATVVGGVCAGLLVTVYLLAVWTPQGQHFEDSVLRAADRVAGTTTETRAVDTLDGITATSVVAAVVLVLLVAVLRRKLLLGFLSVAVIAASVITAEIMQRTMLRPILLAHGYRREDQSFPSGHAAVAMSVMCALVLVAPYRFRGPVVFLSSLWAATVGVATVTSAWHRPSDSIGSDLIVVFWACAAVALLARWGRVREAALRTRPGRVLRSVLAGTYAGLAVLAFGVATVTATTVLADPDRSGASGWTLLAGRALALSGSAAVAAALFALLRRVDIGAPPADRAEEGNPDAELRHAGVYRPSGT
jgi:membrane-associated phospholipid phosphatase